MSKKIIFIRHGKASMDGKDAERVLDEDGVIQAESLKDKLNLLGFDNAKIFSSPFKRALQTIEPFIKQRNLKIIYSNELEEIHIPKNPELSKHQIIEKMWADENYKSDGGMSQREHFSKIENFLNQIFEDFKNNNNDIVIVTHGNLIGIILKFFFKLQFGFAEWKTMTMPDIYLLKFDKKNYFIDMQRNNSNIERIFTI